MKTSLFIEIIQKWFGPIAARLTETFNGTKETPTYLFQRMLKKEYSADLKWNSISADSSNVAADVVSMDSPLPLKKRGSISKANGDIPKLGMKMSKSEKMLSDIQIMRAKGATEAQIVQKVFDDIKKCTVGVFERLELTFLRGLSTGVALVTDSENVGTGIRVDYGYLAKNKFGATVKWGSKGYRPLSDFAKVLEAANVAGNTITKVMMSRAAFNKLRSSEEAKVLAANFKGQVITNNAKLATPTPSVLQEAVNDEYGFEIEIVDRSVRVEKNGKQTTVKPFVENAVVFLVDDMVGRLSYGTLAEEGNPVEGVEYQKVEDYILLSKYSKNDPLREFSSSQAMAIPVIEGVENIYLLNTEDAQDVDGQTEGDANITIYEQTLVKATVIAALKSIGVTVSATISDEDLVKQVNDLSEADEEKLKVALDIA